MLCKQSINMEYFENEPKLEPRKVALRAPLLLFVICSVRGCCCNFVMEINAVINY